MAPLRGISMMDLKNVEATAIRAVNTNDFQVALKRVKATVDQTELEAYLQWDKAFGCG